MWWCCGDLRQKVIDILAPQYNLRCSMNGPLTITPIHHTNRWQNNKIKCRNVMYANTCVVSWQQSALIYVLSAPCAFYGLCISILEGIPSITKHSAEVAGIKRDFPKHQASGCQSFFVCFYGQQKLLIFLYFSQLDFWYFWQSNW